MSVMEVRIKINGNQILNELAVFVEFLQYLICLNQNKIVKLSWPKCMYIYIL